ncbi:MAG: endolytic transglycosylase MltG [Treponema sp.]|nr:endolytic transglycosylase MltG [Treponema sp.]
MKKISKFFIYFFIILIIIMVFVYFGFNYLISPLNPNAKEKTHTFKIIQGSSIKNVALELQKNEIIRNAYAMYILARIKGTIIKSGRYEANASMSCEQILDYLQDGKQANVVVAIPEGLTFTKIAALLEKYEVTKAEDFIEECKNTNTIEKYRISSENLEGYLFPDTYFFDYEMKANKVVQIMVNNFFSKIEKIPELKDLSSQKLHEKIILASIVEREYRISSEAPLIASVFVNRIRRNIGLYSCATIEYIITEIMGKPHPDVITYEDLKINNPYNTYKWAGLPPGPISNPGLIALNAVANPPVTQYYFFRLVDSKKGTHVFSKDFESHTENANNISTKKVAGY